MVFEIGQGSFIYFILGAENICQDQIPQPLQCLNKYHESQIWSTRKRPTQHVPLHIFLGKQIGSDGGLQTWSGPLLRMQVWGFMNQQTQEGEREQVGGKDSLLVMQWHRSAESFFLSFLALSHCQIDTIWYYVLISNWNEVHADVSHCITFALPFPQCSTMIFIEGLLGWGRGVGREIAKFQGPLIALLWLAGVKGFEAA